MNTSTIIALVISAACILLAGCETVDSTESKITTPQSFENAKRFDLANGFLAINLPSDTIELNSLDSFQSTDSPYDPFRMFRSKRLFAFSISTNSSNSQSFYEFFIDSVVYLEHEEKVRELTSRISREGGDYLVCKSILYCEQFGGTVEDVALLKYLRDLFVEYGPNSHGIGEVGYTNTRGDKVSIFYVYRNNPPPDGSYNIVAFTGFHNSKLAFDGSVASDQVDCLGLENTKELFSKIFITANAPNTGR